MANIKNINSERQYYIDWLRIIFGMKKNGKIALLIAGYVLGLLAMVILPVITSHGYSIIRNTLSELGAQSAPEGWIMNLIFVCLAFGSVIAGWNYFEGFLLHRIVLVLFGISLTLMAFFNHAPLNPGIRYNLTEASLHEYFSGTMGLSFVILSISTSLILERQSKRLLAIAVGISIILLSVMMSEAEMYAGIWQRLMFIISFGWMIYTYSTSE